MQKLDVKEVNKKRKPNPIFKGLPTKLKDVACFERVEKELYEILKSDHKHKTAGAYVKCQECNSRREERQTKMKKIGFKSYQQYLEWKKVMSIIKNQSNFQLR